MTTANAPLEETITLLAFGGVLTGTVVYIGLTRRLIQAVFALFLVLFCVAGLFALQGADFLAVAQLVLYVGGVLVLLLFGVMLTGRSGLIADELPKTPLKQVLPALLVVGGIGVLLWNVFGTYNWGPPLPNTPQPALAFPNGTVKAIGTELLGPRALVFELASVLLLLALIGAAYLAREQRRT